MYKPTYNSSLIQERNEERTDFSTQLFGNTQFRIGVIIESIDIDDDTNISKLSTEYHVMTVEQDKQNGQNTSVYKNCIAMDGFGGVADFFQFTQRPVEKPKETQKKGSLKEEVGSIVGILCLDGNSEKAVIIGSFGNPSRNVLLSKDKEHHMEGEFNGVNWSVDKEGALTIVFRSKTDAEGVPQDTDAGGTRVKIEEDGSFEVNNGPLSNKEQKGYKKVEGQVENQEVSDNINIGLGNVSYEKLRMDKTDKTINMEARNNMSFKTNKSFNFEAKESMDIQLKKDLIVSAEGKASLVSNTMFDVKTNGMFSLKAGLVKCESESIIQMKSQSLIDINAASVAQLKAPSVLLGTSPSQPALLAFTLQTLGIGNLGAPVVSAAIAGFSTQIFLSA